MIESLAPEHLTAVALYCVDTWKPQGNTTYCNFSVEHVARMYGCRTFTAPDGRPRLANEIADLLPSAAHWRLITSSYEDAQTLANAGRLIVAAKALPTHGHVAYLVPGKMEASGQYKGMVPRICNVGPGRWHGITTLNYGFSYSNRPKLYIYEPNNPKGKKS